MKILRASKVLALLAVCASALLLNTANATSGYQEGVHFKQIPGAKFQQDTVEEFFSFYCPACYRAEGAVKEIKANLPANLTFVRRHVNGMPGIPITMQNDLSKFLIASRAINQEEAFVKSVFTQIHVQKDKDFSGEKLQQLLKVNAIDTESFNKALVEQGVESAHDNQLKRLKQMREGGFGGVPAFVVNGKYQLLTHNIGGLEDFTALISYLSKKDS